MPALLDAETEMRAAQDVAARAAWAGAPAPGFTPPVRSTADRRAEMVARAALSNRLGLALVLLPLLLSVVVVRGLGPTGVLGRALRRVGIGALVLFVASPLAALVVGGMMWLLWAVIGIGAPLVVLAAVVVLLVGLAVHGWLRRDARVQLATGLLVAYLALGGLLVLLAARGGDLQITLPVLSTAEGLMLIAATFLLTVAALATLGQGLALEGWSRPGWATTLLGLLLIPLAVYLSFIPGMTSDLTHTLGNPALYAGPIGWLTGCAAPAAPTSAPEEIVEIEVTQMVEQEGETIVEATEVATTPSPASTMEPAATPTPVSGPAEPFPLRQVFPETLYWSAESFTDENGHLALDLPLVDNITTWRLTALASTREGELGVAAYDLVVFQDFFVDLDLPPVVAQGEVVTASVTLYNYLPQAQTIQIEPIPAEWYTIVSLPRPLSLPPNDVAAVHLSIRPEQSGQFSLQVTAAGDLMSDAVAQDVTVENDD